MVFSSLLFLFLFLPVTLGVYFLTPARYRNMPALAASLLFFAWGAPRIVFLLAATSLVDYLAGSRLAPGRLPDRRRKGLLAAAILLNLGFLLYFKYANFFVDQVNALLAATGMDPVAWTRVILPIGISFFTFQKISYLVDVYRGTANPAVSYGRYLLYVVFFPQLIAGPIVRYHDVDRQLGSRSYTTGQFLDGLWRFALGLAKKVLLANALGRAADAAFSAGPDQLPCGAAWLGLAAYAMQIYYDFAGYSDMAIGLGRMMGIHFLENFNFPYTSSSITEFWRRWHISLGNFMREYLYIPLGGNRGSRVRTYFNLWIVFLASGFWHGASWSFVVWGCFHGIALSMDRFLKDRGFRPLPKPVAVPLTFLLVCLAWVPFRAETLARAGDYFMALGNATSAAAGLGKMSAPFTDPRFLLVLAIALLGAFGPLLGWSRPLLASAEGGEPDLPAPSLVRRFLLSGALMVACAAVLAMGGFNPFIYFRF
jgi:alginate O-acetyltransferase complex protein AlgI